jgi:uncharacterized OB-fold protein
MSAKPINDTSFNEYLQEKRLMGSVCQKCGAKYVPPRAVCVNCYGRDITWSEFKGSGTLAAFTVISVMSPAMTALGYGRDNPYVSGVVELDEGGRVDARIVGVDTKNPASIEVGMPLKVTYLTEAGDEVTLAFEPLA